MTRLLYFVMCAAGLRTRRERAPHASQDLQPSARWVRRPAAQYLRSYAVALCLCAAAVAGCTVGPNYQRPEAGAPDEFRGEAAAAPPASLGELPWWEVFRDDTLEGLLRAALANNYDLRVAVTRIDQARAVSMQARSQFFPQLAYDIEADRGRNTFFGRPVPSAGGAVGPKTFNSFLGALDASWEVDLWGRIRRLNESAQAQLLATEEARRGVTITLVADVAQAYYELLELDRELEIARQTTDSFAKSLQLFQDRYKGGVTSRLETSRAEASLASTAASVPNLQRLILIKENQLSILLGRPPGSIPRPTTLLAQALPPEVPAGLPSALLERRPDVRQAEQLMRSANAQVGVAVANFFPQINLTGLLGGAS
ncbi:MAG: efflux transporter outer membrane subunit, partial [Planctomycetota bacterium]|nr:efflux transporter outer membrane subunit [Planctomycetota bacterium]